MKKEHSQRYEDDKSTSKEKNKYKGNSFSEEEEVKSNKKIKINISQVMKKFAYLKKNQNIKKINIKKYKKNKVLQKKRKNIKKGKKINTLQIQILQNILVTKNI